MSDWRETAAGEDRTGVLNVCARKCVRAEVARQIRRAVAPELRGHGKFASVLTLPVREYTRIGKIGRLSL